MRKPVLAGGYAYGTLRRDVSALKENTALERKWQKEREARMVAAFLKNPGIERANFAERFGCTEDCAAAVLRKHGYKFGCDLISTWSRGRYSYDKKTG